MKQILVSGLLIFFILPLIACGNELYGYAPPTVEKVDLESYVGKWFEIKRIENDFQDNEPMAGEGVCYNVTAEYGFLPQNKISVKNTCYRKSRVEIANAKAKSVRGSNNAKLKVNFTGIPFLEWLGIGNGDYWILALGDKNSENLYSWVLVGSPDLKYGWILSRDLNLDEIEIERALSIAESVGYDASLFKSFRK
jgi:apolipoprotein D and lipocalin family protein